MVLKVQPPVQALSSFSTARAAPPRTGICGWSCARTTPALSTLAISAMAWVLRRAMSVISPTIFRGGRAGEARVEIAAALLEEQPRANSWSAIARCILC